MRGRRIKTALWSVLGLLAVLLVALLVSQPYLFTPTYVEEAGPKRDVVIRRDKWGVPHIVGRTDADASFGLAWAHAEDDFATLQRVLMTMRGRLGELDGADGAASDYGVSLLGARRVAERKYGMLAPATRRLLDGYTQGLNLYAARHPEQVIARGLFPVRGQDIVTGFLLAPGSHYGLTRAVGSLVEGKPLPPEGGASVAGKGSNGFAVSPRKSGDGSTWFVANSHVDWEGPSSWYEAHLTSGEGMNVSGAGFPGSPIPNSGHNGNVAWMSTDNRPDLYDIYRLVLDEGGERYRLDGQWLPLEKRRVWLWIKVGPLSVPIPKMAYASRHGPVVKTATGAYAVRWGGMDDPRAVEQFYRFTKARDWNEWHAAARIRAWPTTNFVYADRTGRIGFFYNGAFPRRFAGVNWQSVLPGDQSRLIWRDYVDWDRLPRVMDPQSGYVFSANHTPWRSSAPQDNPKRENYPTWLGVEEEMTNRAWRAETLLAAAPVLDFATLHRIKYDTVVDKRSVIGRQLALVMAADLSRRPELQAPQAVLRKFDWSFDGRGEGETLAAELVRHVQALAFFRRPLLSPEEMLTNAMTFFDERGLRYDAPLAALNRVGRGKVDLAMPGGSDVLAALASFSKPGKAPRLGFGDSYIAFVRWRPDGRVEARSVVPYGASSRASSPHYSDQSRLFATAQLKPAWYYEDELRPNIVRSYRPR